MRLIKLVFLALLLTLSQFAVAADIRTMLHDALVNGSYDGVAGEDIAKVFNIRTLSTEPLNISIKKLRKFEGDCAEFKFMFKQTGLRNMSTNEIILDPVTKQPALLDLQFNLPICMNGSTPAEAIEEERQREANLMNACKIRLVKGKKTTDSQEATFVYNGCPARGHVRLNYQGTCMAIQQSPNTYARFDFDKNGHAEVKLKIPATCAAQPPESSRWTMQIFENLNLYEHQVGSVYKFWEK